MKIFLDDERDPWTDDWIVARNFEEFCAALELSIDNDDPISEISFDHDLGEEKNGLDCAKEFVEAHQELSFFGFELITKDFILYVHSQNPVGKANIEGYINGYFNHIE